MINLNKKNRKSVSHPPLFSPFKKICPWIIPPPHFFYFSDSPSPGKIIKIYPPPSFKKGGGGSELCPYKPYHFLKECNENFQTKYVSCFNRLRFLAEISTKL